MFERLVSQLSELRADVQECPVTFLRLAARLAALGDKTQLDWFFTQNVPDLESALEEICRASWKDLQVPTAEMQGLAVIAAQDLMCLVALAGDRISSKSRIFIEALADAANETLLCPEAAERIEYFSEEFHIPSEIRLPVISYPLTEEAMAVLIAMGETTEVVSRDNP